MEIGIFMRIWKNKVEELSLKEEMDQKVQAIQVYRQKRKFIRSLKNFAWEKREERQRS